MRCLCFSSSTLSSSPPPPTSPSSSSTATTLVSGVSVSVSFALWCGVCMHLLLAAVSSSASVLRSVGCFVVVGCNASSLFLSLSLPHPFSFYRRTSERRREAPLSPFEVIHLHPVAVVSSVPPSRPNPTPEASALANNDGRAFFFPGFRGAAGGTRRRRANADRRLVR